MINGQSKPVIGKDHRQMKVLITGAEGFIGKNLQERLNKIKDLELLKWTKFNNFSDLEKFVDRRRGGELIKKFFGRSL